MTNDQSMGNINNFFYRYKGHKLLVINYYKSVYYSIITSQVIEILLSFIHYQNNPRLFPFKLIRTLNTLYRIDSPLLHMQSRNYSNYSAMPLLFSIIRHSFKARFNCQVSVNKPPAVQVIRLPFFPSTIQLNWSGCNCRHLPRFVLCI